MKTIKLEIFSENEDFNFHLEEFLIRNSSDFKKIKQRVSNLTSILDDDNIDNRVEGKFKIRHTSDYSTHDIFGETYEQTYCDAVSLSRATHIIKSIEILDNKIFSKIRILKTHYGDIISEMPEDFICLRPVYLIGSDRILTFNIDKKTIKQAA